MQLKIHNLILRLKVFVRLLFYFIYRWLLFKVSCLLLELFMSFLFTKLIKYPKINLISSKLKEKGNKNIYKI
jgi:hypothetical protein